MLFLRSEGLQLRKMIWPWRRKSRRRMARIVVDGPITGSTRQRVVTTATKDEVITSSTRRLISPGRTNDKRVIVAQGVRIKHVLAARAAERG